MNDSIKDTYLVVDTDTKAVFGHYDTPGKANGQVKRKGSRYAVYVVDAAHPLTKPEPPKKVIEDLTEVSWIETLEDCQEYMRDSMVDTVRHETEHGRCGDDEVTEVFAFQGKFYEITVEIEWNRYDKQFYYVDGSSVVRCEECECPE